MKEPDIDNKKKSYKTKGGKLVKVCYKAGAVTAQNHYYSIAADAVEIRVWFLTDDIIRIRAGFDGDWDEASYSLVTTAWESRTDELMKD